MYPRRREDDEQKAQVQLVANRVPKHLGGRHRRGLEGNDLPKVRQCEAKDERERAELTANREKLKASANKRKDGGGEGLDISSKSKNQSDKRFERSQGKTSQGDTLFCALCKAADASG